MPSDEEGKVNGFDLVFRKPLTSYARVSCKKLQDRQLWRRLVEAFCTDGHEKDK